MNNGAVDLVKTLLKSGVDTCFANPGTSEMHFVAALKNHPQMRSVLCLFEGVVTGAADGYGRMAGKPAVTLLHLGPGLANGLANLHNAKKSHTPIVNVIGDHATFHKPLDAPLNSDVQGTAAPYSHVVLTSRSADTVSADVAAAVAAANSKGGQIVSLVLPADAAWNETSGKINQCSRDARIKVDQSSIETAVSLLSNGRKTGLVLGGQACFGEGLTLAEAIAEATGVTLMTSYATARLERGSHRVPITRIPFPVPLAVELLADFEQLIFLGAKEPVAFFAYPGLPSRVCDPGCNLFDLADPTSDILDALHRLNEQFEAPRTPREIETPIMPVVSEGALTPDTLADVVACSLQEGTILVDEGVTSTRGVFDKTAHGPRHDLLVNVGGSIGAGLPLALGAAVACPDRPVLCLSGDGSASYTPQALWSIMQQDANVTIVICANHTYAILKIEMERVGAILPDQNQHPLLDIDTPKIDWVALATGYGMPATRVTTAEALAKEIARGGPRLIEASL